jgi:D-lactate dehydrogenase
VKLTFFETENWQKKYIKEKLKSHQINFVNDELTVKNVSKAKDSEGIGVFIYSEITKEVIDRLPKVKFIVTMSTGYNHINVKYCKSKGIKVCNVPYYGENTVAEHAVGLMLALSKNLPEATARTRKGDFDLEGLEGFDLKGKTLGVIGAGHIGQHVIQIAKAMEMDVVAFNRSKDLMLAKKLGFTYVSLDNLLKKSDIVSLHLQLVPKTKHIINMKNIKKMKRGSYVINTARGGLIETKALIYGLDKGILAGAALDVLEGEDDLKDERLHKKLTSKEKKLLKANQLLLKDKEVLITPHSAFYTKEALMRILDTTIENVRSRGRVNCV